MPTMIWGIISAVLFGVQFFSGSIDFLFPAASALVVALLALIPGFSGLIWLQLLIWAGLSAASILWLRKHFSFFFTGKIAHVDRFEHAGKEARVLEAIAPGKPGRIMFQGTSWQAISMDEVIQPGTVVSILEQEGLSFTVSAHSLIEEGNSDQ